ELMAEARRLAARLCQSAPLAVRATKEVAVRSRTMSWVEAVRFGEAMRLGAGSTTDAAEGRAAFRDKRAPHWQGREIGEGESPGGRRSAWPDMVSDDASEEVVFWQCRRHSTLRQDVVVVGICGLVYIGGQAEPVRRVRVDLGRVGAQGALYLLPVVADEDLGGDAIVHRGVPLPALSFKRRRQAQTQERLMAG